MRRRDLLFVVVIVALAIGWIMDRQRLTEEIEQRKRDQEEWAAIVDKSMAEMRCKLSEAWDKIEKRHIEP